MPTYVTLVKSGAEAAKSMGDLRKEYEEGAKMAESRWESSSLAHTAY